MAVGMTCNFTIFSTVFQSYLKDDMVTIKCYDQGISIYGSEDFGPVRSESGRLDQQNSADSADPVQTPVLVLWWF